MKNQSKTEELVKIAALAFYTLTAIAVIGLSVYFFVLNPLTNH